MGNTAIAKLSSIRKALEQAKTIGEVIDVRDQAEAVATYAKAIGLSVQNVNSAVEVKLRAERKAGALIASLPGFGTHGGNRKASRPIEGLETLGVERHQSQRWQKLSEMPDEAFDSFLWETNDQGKELTTASVMRQWSLLRKPANGNSLASGGTLSAALERLHASIKRIYSDWPEDSRKQLADKLRAYADELDETGELAL